MTESNAWIEMNMQRQRKMLEDKQKQKRNQSAGSVRTTTHSQGIGGGGYGAKHTPYSSPFEPPSLPFSMADHHSFSSSVNNLNNAPVLMPVAPMAAPRTSQPSAVPVEPLIDYESEITEKLVKKNLASCVSGSDDEDDKRSHSSSPWNCNDVAVNRIPGEVLPDFEFIKKNLRQFVTLPAVEHCQYKCTITRQKSGMDKSMFPTYFLHLEEIDSDRRQKIFILAARKRKKSTTANYLLSTDPTNLSKNSDGYCGKVRSNLLGTSFTVYDEGLSPKKTSVTFQIRQELAGVIYDTNVLGFKGPRKMTIILPGIEPGNDKMPQKRTEVRPLTEKHTLLERFKSNDLLDLKVLNNKNPQWNDETQSYVLNFHGRVTQASVKNFQIVHNDAPEYIVMQFGRISDDEFTMDYKYPMSAVQAFGIAMTSFHGKLACE